uniref:Myo1 n=1 Tax=Arundo donax TaxID=35708 RepID=A0A0A9AZ40_ARUDO
MEKKCKEYLIRNISLPSTNSPRTISSGYFLAFHNTLDFLGANLLRLFLYTNVFSIGDHLKQ